MARLPFTLTLFASSRATRMAALSLLVLAMLMTLGWKGFLFFTGLAPQSTTPIVSSDTLAVHNSKSKPRNALANLFGSSELASGKSSAHVEKLPESNLNLHVSAIFFRTTPGQSSVIIEDGDKTLILKPGDEARPGISIQQIESDRITLARNGKLEQISFRGFAESASETAGLSSLPTHAGQSSRVVAEPAARAASRPAGSLASIDGSGAPQPGVSTAYQNYIQRKLAQTKQ